MTPGREALAGHLRGQISAVGLADVGAAAHGSPPRHRPFYDPEFRHNDTEAVYRSLMHTEFGFVHEVLTFTRRPTAGSETSYAHRVNTLMPEFLRLHMRYGPGVLTYPGVPLRPALVAQAVSCGGTRSSGSGRHVATTWSSTTSTGGRSD